MTLDLFSPEPFVLVVDDSPSDARRMQALVQVALPESIVVTRHSAEEAMNVCEYHLPNLIVADVHLPGESGFELCKRIKSDRSPCRDILVLMVSADENRASTACEAIASGAYAFEAKPLNTKRFVEDIRAGLALSDARRNRLILTREYLGGR